LGRAGEEGKKNILTMCLAPAATILGFVWNWKQNGPLKNTLNMLIWGEYRDLAGCFDNKSKRK